MNTKRLIASALLTLLFCAIAMAQETADKETPQNGVAEFGVRHIEGDVYGRPDLPFRPSLFDSKFNEYRDIRNGFFIRRFRVWRDDFLGSANYVDFQSNNSIYRDQSYLATFGRYSRFKLQFRYDEIPHRYSNTTRTLYTQTRPGVFTISPFIRGNLQAIAASTTLPSVIQNQIVPGEQLFVPQIERRAGSAYATYEFSDNWNVFGYFWREHQSGARPLGQVFNSSPSAALSGGFGAEVPEPINYYNNLAKVGTEYGRGDWGVQIGYTGSFFQNRVGELDYDNPFRATNCVASVTPGACTAATQGPAFGRVDLWPDNSANYVSIAAAFNVAKFARAMASITPGWLRQNDRFLPYTTNAPLLAQTAALPAASLNGKKQTLAMNYTLATKTWKKLEFVAKYRHYDYNNNTASRTFTPVEGDVGAPTTDENNPIGYNRKNFQATGNWLFMRKSSLKLGYEGEWMDRSLRNVAHSVEHSLISSLDVQPTRDFSFRLAYRHANRLPDAYVDEAFDFDNPAGGITEEQPFHRRFDEAARLRDRFDASAQYNLGDRITLSAFANTTQDNYNRRGGTNSASALNFIAGTTNPYYLYGVLKDLSWDYGADIDYSFSPAVSFFGEYSREQYHKRMTSRYRVPGSAAIALPLNCSDPTKGCDSPNNDWESTTRDFVNVYTTGFDFYLGKKVYLTTYYSLAAGLGQIHSRPLGDPTITTGPNKFLLTGTNAAVDYPEYVSRSHEVTVIFKYKLTSNFMPKIEYRYQQWDNKDYQTTPMTPYMGCVSNLPPAAPVPGCTAPLLGTPSPFYPYFVVGDPNAARYLFLGTDQPSFRSHYIAATLEYHF